MRKLLSILFAALIALSSAALSSCSKQGGEQAPIASAEPRLCQMSIRLDESVGGLENVNKTNYVPAVISLDSPLPQFSFENLPAEFRGRGQNHAPKQGWKLKFNQKLSLFGREENKHFALIAGHDYAMIKNGLAQSAAKVLDGIEYSTPVVIVELTIDGDYRGVYYLFESVKVAKGRIDIESKIGQEDTGFLIEYDAWAEGRHGIDYFTIDVWRVNWAFTVHSPDPDDVTPANESAFRAQVQEIKEYVERTYYAAIGNPAFYEPANMANFFALADANSFADIYILHELTKNIDTGTSSFFLYKKPNGGKLFAGPPWDFDLSIGYEGLTGAEGPSGILVASEDFHKTDNRKCALYVALMQEPEFESLAKQRFLERQSAIKDAFDNFYNELQLYGAAFSRDFSRWSSAYASLTPQFPSTSNSPSTSAPALSSPSLSVSSALSSPSVNPYAFSQLASLTWLHTRLTYLTNLWQNS